VVGRRHGRYYAVFQKSADELNVPERGRTYRLHLARRRRPSPPAGPPAATTHFTARGWAIVNAALLAIVIAELARCGTIIASYRRGWHG